MYTPTASLLISMICFRILLHNALYFRSISEVTAPSLTTNVDDKTKSHKPAEEPVKKIQKLTETTPVQPTSETISYVLPNEMEGDIKPCIDKLVKVRFVSSIIT